MLTGDFRILEGILQIFVPVGRSADIRRVLLHDLQVLPSLEVLRRIADRQEPLLLVERISSFL